MSDDFDEDGPSALDSWEDPDEERKQKAVAELEHAQRKLEADSEEFNAKVADVEERMAIQNEDLGPEPPPPPQRVAVGPGRDEPPRLAGLPESDRGFEPAPDFLHRVNELPPPGWLINELIPDEGIVVWHGRPRSMKSLCATDVHLCLTTDQEALHNGRFACAQGPQVVLYLTEEDSERLFAFRLNLLRNGYGWKGVPPRLRIRIRPGWNLETRDGQSALLEAIYRCKPEPRVLVIDPARGSLPSVDGGPKDAAPAIAFLREIMRETSITTIHLPHHDVKPSREQKDERARPDRASGGVVFSIADCPVNFERLDERGCLAVPSHYKIGNDPQPFRVRFKSATPMGTPFHEWLSAEATTDTEDEAIADRNRQKILDYLTGKGSFLTAKEIDRAVNLRSGESGRLLAQLEAAGKLECVSGESVGRSKRAKVYGLRDVRVWEQGDEDGEERDGG